MDQQTPESGNVPQPQPQPPGRISRSRPRASP